MAEAQDTSERRSKRVWRIALPVMGCWTVLVGVVAFCVLFGWQFGSGATMGPEQTKRHGDIGDSILVGGVALAVAPWVIGSIVLVMRWWRSRTPAPPEPAE